MHFMPLFYSVIIGLNKFEKNNIIDNIGPHKRIDQTWVVNDNNGASLVNHRYPLIIHDFLLKKLNEDANNNVTLSHVKRSIRRGLIFINGRKATNEWNVQIGDTVQLVSQYSVAALSRHISSTGYFPNDITNQRMKSVGVLFEDDHCAVVNKPQGMTIFPTPGSAGQSADWSLQSALLLSLQPFNSSTMQKPGGPDENVPGSISPLRRPQCVHRLDKGTGGLVLVAKTRLALTALTGFFMDRKVSKKYLALLKGKMVLQDTIGLNVESRGSSKELIGVASFDVDGKQAVSEVRVLSHSPCPQLGWVTLVEVSPLTGRTHQIRKHMQLLGHSIVGDKRYGGSLQLSSGSEEFNSNDNLDLYDNIMYLWAVSLSFPHPIYGHTVEISLPEPFEISKRLAQYN